MLSSLVPDRNYKIVGYKHGVFYISGIKSKDLLIFAKDSLTGEVASVQISLTDPKITSFIFCPKIYVTLEEWLDYAVENNFDFFYEQTDNGAPVGSLTHYYEEGRCDLTSSFRVIIDKED
jgi:hypothetical protein